MNNHRNNSIYQSKSIYSEISQFYCTDNTEPRICIPKGKYLSQILEKQHYLERTVTDIISSTGSGKMYAIRKIQEETEEFVIYVSPLRKLITQAKKDLNAFGYEDDIKSMNGKKIFATTIDSLCLNNPNKTLFLKRANLDSGRKKICLVLDEVHQVAESLFNTKKQTNYPEFIEFCHSNVDRIITLTATETSFSRDFSETLAKDICFNHHRFFFKGMEERIKLNHLSLSHREIMPKILEIVQNKDLNRGLFIFQSKEKTFLINEMINKLSQSLEAQLDLQESDICLVNAETQNELDEFAKIIIGSPSLATGISINTKVDLCVIVLDDSIFRPHDIEQYAARIRKPHGTEFFLISTKHRNQPKISYQSSLESCSSLLQFTEMFINNETEDSLFIKDENNIYQLKKDEVRLLELDVNQQRWYFHPLYFRYKTEGMAFRSFCRSTGAFSFVNYLRDNPHPDYSFEIQDYTNQIHVDEETQELVEETIESRKELKIKQFQEISPLSNIAQYDSAKSKLDELKKNDLPMRKEEREQLELEKQYLIMEIKKTQASLLGVDTTGLDLNRATQEVTKRLRFSTIFSLFTIVQLDFSTLFYDLFYSELIMDDNLNGLYSTSKYDFVRWLNSVKHSRASLAEKRNLIRDNISDMTNEEFKSIFEMNKSKADSASKQNEGTVVNKLVTAIIGKGDFYNQLGIDYRVYRSVLNVLEYLCDESLVKIMEGYELNKFANDPEIYLNKFSIKTMLIEYQSSLSRCTSISDLWKWYLSFSPEFDFILFSVFPNEDALGKSRTYKNNLRNEVAIMFNSITTKNKLKELRNKRKIPAFMKAVG